MLSAAYGFAAISLAALGVIGLLGTRRILLSPDPGTPLEAAVEGCRGLAQLVRAWPAFLLIAIGAKLTMLLLTSGVKIVLARHLPAQIILVFWVDIGFTLAWAFIAVRIDLAILAPEAQGQDIRRRVRRAMLYAAAFWGANAVFTFAAFLLATLQQARGQLVIRFLLGYTPYIFIILSALTRPAIAIDLPRPFRECLRILRENWFGLATTLGIGVLPLGAVFLTAFLIRVAAHPTFVPALLLELPLGVLAALFYAGYEATIAAAYRRIM